MKKRFWVHDIEVFPNFFCTSIREIGTDKIITFEISDRKNQLKELQEFYKKREKEFIISFNGKDFDDFFINVILPVKTVTNKQLYNLGQYLIKMDKWWESKIKDFRHSKWFTVDLFRFWSKMLRLSKNLSLKSLGIQMNYHTVQDLPYPFDKHLTHEEMDHVIAYNIHDINITEMLFNKKKKEFDMRMDVYKEHKIDCFAYDDPKIAMTLLKIEYEKTGKEFSSLKKEFSSININDILLSKIVELIKTLPKKNCNKFNTYYSVHNYLEYLQNLSVSSMSEISAKIITTQKNGMILESILGSGGIHSTAFKGVLTPKDGECLLDIDYSSFYPSLIEILGGLGDALPTYSKIKETRIRYKKLMKHPDTPKDKIEYYNTQQSKMKLQINGTYGMLNNKYSDISNMKDALSTTINGQLILQFLMESVTIKFDCSAIYANTDGIVLLCKQKDKENIKMFLENISTSISDKLVLEYEEFSKMILSNVNNFINITTSGKLKKKGKLFITNPKLGDSVDQLIVPKALEAYYTKGIPIDEFLRSHDNIFDFCCSKKVACEILGHYKPI